MAWDAHWDGYWDGYWDGSAVPAGTAETSFPTITLTAPTVTAYDSAGDATASTDFATITLTAPTVVATASSDTPSGTSSAGGSVLSQPSQFSRVASYTVDDLTRTLRSKYYQTTQELADDITRAMSALARQPSVDRGLKKNVIADVQGGTTLGVGDVSATHVSDYLVQNGQQGQPRNVGSGLRTRRQTRIRSSTRVLAAKVLEDAPAGATEVSVMIVGASPVVGMDSQTGIQIVANASGGLADGVDVISGKQMMAKMTGQPIVSSGSTGIQPITAGSTVSVAVTEQYEDTTTWTRRDRKNLPVVTSVLKCDSACLVNGLACAGTICTPYVTDEHYFDKPFSPAVGVDWTFLQNIDPADEGKAWCVVELSSDVPNGTIDRAGGDFAYYDYGIVGPGGVITFTGVPYSVPDGAYHFWFDDNIPGIDKYPMPNYRWAVMVGCNVGQSVNFGPFIPNDTDGRAKSWTLIDSNFPLPL